MSIDNGVYIIKDKKGYRVCEAQAIENLWWWNTESKDTKKWEQREGINPKEVERYFGKSECYNTITQAYERAIELYKETIDNYGMCEYGIQDLGDV